jgi:hypothetical protein
MLDEFCPVPETLRSTVCTLVEGQIISKDKPCSERDHCLDYMTALAGAWPSSDLLSQKEKPRKGA